MSTVSRAEQAARDPRAAVAQVRRWYHVIEVARGIVTPGWFDLRQTVERLPWPDVRGKRCLDVGTSSGFLAFELERRGAAEVLATDIGSFEEWDWEHSIGALGPRYLREVEGPELGAGFEVARSLLKSSVTRRAISVYDLSPETVGEFDVVVCGSLLLHLRDPLRALAAIRSVCRGWLLSADQVDPLRSLVCPRRALIRLDGTAGETQWWVPNVAGHRQMLLASGFAVERETGVYAVPYGPAHPPAPRNLAGRLRHLGRRLVGSADGVPHHAILARPA